MPNSVPTPASAGSGLSLNVRVWKIFAPLAFSIDVRRDSFEPTTVDFCESTDARAPPPARLAVDSPPNGDDVDALCLELVVLLEERREVVRVAGGLENGV